MGWIDWTLAIATIVVGIVLTIVVMLQSSKDQQSAITEVILFTAQINQKH